MCFLLGQSITCNGLVSMFKLWTMIQCPIVVCLFSMSLIYGGGGVDWLSKDLLRILKPCSSKLSVVMKHQSAVWSFILIEKKLKNLIYKFKSLKTKIIQVYKQNVIM